MVACILFVFLAFCLAITLKGVQIKTSICGDGIWNNYDEECDSTVGCSDDCFCKGGFMPDGKGNCLMSCIYGKACLTGCIEPDVCEKCNVSMGYTNDCSRCVDGYMWYGIGCCEPMNNPIESCFSFQRKADEIKTQLGYNPFQINLGVNSGLDENGMIVIPSMFQINETSLHMAQCSRYVDPTKPFTFGYFINVTSDSAKYVCVELDKKYSRNDLSNAQTQGIIQGNSMAMSVQKECTDSIDILQKLTCLTENGGYSEYIRSPRIITTINTNEPIFVFIHSKYASFKLSSFKLFINELIHPCSSDYYDVESNEITNGGYTLNLTLDNSVESKSTCSKDKTKGYWFRITGIEQTIDVSTCNSKSEYDVGLNLIKINLEDFGYEKNAGIISKVNCDDLNNAKCVISRKGGCDGKIGLSRMIFSLEEGFTYFLFVSINERGVAEVNLNISLTCNGDCGEHGVCSTTTGKCVCENGFVLNDGICSRCGNGKLDEGEECDFSVEGYTDSNCGSTCSCYFGYSLKEINGITKCSIPTCGNGRIDDYEECDGGYGCDHCVCVNGTKKYAQARRDCIPLFCGNKKWDEGEECDEGNGCVECECQLGWYSQHSADCTSTSPTLMRVIIITCGIVVYWVIYCLISIPIGISYGCLNKRIKEQIKTEKMNIFENVIVPFDKTNSQYIDLKQNNVYFSFSSNTITFEGKRPDIDEPIETNLVMTNHWKYPLHFTFHCGIYNKYDITCNPFAGTLPSNESVNLKVTFMAKCTCSLNEKIPITIRYGRIDNIMRDIKKSYPNLIEQNSQSSCNSESDGNISLSKSNNSFSRDLPTPRNIQNEPSTELKLSKLTLSGSGKSDSDNPKKKKGKLKVTKFHVYLNLQVESALSTKLDYEEIHLQHPQIGSGTFGIVYRAEWRRVDVAVKVMKTDLVGLAELLPNFMQEAEMMERIRCPYIVNFIGSVATTDTLCLVTEFCSLGSLRKFMKLNPMPDLIKVRFCQDIAKGMEYLHQNDILHRDLKTDNVLVYSKNPHDPITAKVTDFGTSRSFIESSGKIALQNIGTPVYMAPEINRKDQMTLKSDVFSFAICMLEVWIGKDPYDPAKFPDSESILKFVGAGKRIDITDDCIFKDIIEKAWKHKASERPSFGEIVSLLEVTQKKLNKTLGSDSNCQNLNKSKVVSSSERKTETTATNDETNEKINPNTQTTGSSCFSANGNDSSSFTSEEN